MRAALLIATAALVAGCTATTDRPGTVLGELTWYQAEQLLTPDTIVVIPIGAEAKEHGPHLLLMNDLLIAEYLTERVLNAADVVVAPILNYHYYPAFVEYPGSTTLELDTARDLVLDIVRSLANYGPRRFYALNTGVSTNRALAPAAEILAREGIAFTYTDLRSFSDLHDTVSEQEGGSHADEIETSMMLYMAPWSVDMTRAVRDYDPRPLPGLTRERNDKSTYSPTGTWGDPTLATHAKGRIIVEGMVAGILSDIEALRAMPVLPRTSD